MTLVAIIFVGLVMLFVVIGLACAMAFFGTVTDLNADFTEVALRERAGRQAGASTRRVQRRTTGHARAAERHEYRVQRTNAERWQSRSGTGPRQRPRRRPQSGGGSKR